METRTVILSNIGNRNLKVRNSEGNLVEIDKRHFYRKTQDIWDNYSDYKSRLEVCILPAILSQFPTAELVLFTTQQSAIHESDTYYEGLIIKQLLAETHPSTRVSLVDLEGIDPTKENELIEFYYQWLNKTKGEQPEFALILYDTGGTSQQKVALKAVVGFLFQRAGKEENQSRSGKYVVYQGVKKGEDTFPELVERTAAERLELMANIRLLLDQFEYGGALRLAEQLGKDSDFFPILRYSALRWENMWEELDKEFHESSFSSKVRQEDGFRVVSDFLKPSEKNSQLGELPLGLSYKYHRKTSNMISKAFNLFRVSDYTGATLALHQFIEMFVNIFIEQNTAYKLYSRHGEYASRLFKDLSSRDLEEVSKKIGKEVHSATFPVLIWFCQEKIASQYPNNGIVEFLKHVNNIVSGAGNISTLRNKAAHNGKGVSEKKFERFKEALRYFYGIYFSRQKDVFQVLNQLIVRLMVQ